MVEEKTNRYLILPFGYSFDELDEDEIEEYFDYSP